MLLFTVVKAESFSVVHTFSLCIFGYSRGSVAKVYQWFAKRVSFTKRLIKVDQMTPCEATLRAHKKPMTVKFKGATFILLQMQCAFVMKF